MLKITLRAERRIYECCEVTDDNILEVLDWMRANGESVRERNKSCLVWDPGDRWGELNQPSLTVRPGDRVQLLILVKDEGGQ